MILSSLPYPINVKSFEQKEEGETIFNMVNAEINGHDVDITHVSTPTDDTYNARVDLLYMKLDMSERDLNYFILGHTS